MPSPCRERLGGREVLVPQSAAAGPGSARCHTHYLGTAAPAATVYHLVRVCRRTAACLPQLLEPRPPPNLVPWRRGARAGPAASGRLGLSTSTWHKQDFRRRGGSGPGQRRGTPSGSRYGESSGHEVVPLPALVQLDVGEWPLYALWNFRRLSRKILTGGRHSGQSAFDGEMYWSLCGATGFVR